MRVVLFTTEEPLYLPGYLEPVFEDHAEALNAVVFAPSQRSRFDQIRRQFGFLGPKAFPQYAVRYALGRAAARLEGSPLAPGIRAITARPRAVGTLASEHAVPTIHATDVADPAFIDRIEAMDPDLILSVIPGQKLGPTLLSIPDHAVNLHGSLLPDYRGRATAFWPLFYGDDETGVTAHLMTDTWDAGPIVEQQRVQIEENETVHSLYRKLAETGGELACDLLDRYPSGFDTRPNRTTPEDYHTLPTPEERRLFRDRGGEFL